MLCHPGHTHPLGPLQPCTQQELACLFFGPKQTGREWKKCPPSPAHSLVQLSLRTVTGRGQEGAVAAAMASEFAFRVGCQVFFHLDINAKCWLVPLWGGQGQILT